MLKNILFALSALAMARAQIPSLGWCPDYVPMANFDMSKFLGVWYEAERYFQILDPVSRCVMANYTVGLDGKYRVSNEVTNRFTGIKRVLEGEIKTPTTKAEEGKLQVKYTAVPLTPETQYAVLETDYKSFAVMWSCSGIGPISAQNAWVMTRDRRPDGPVLQKAYGVLDKYKISRTFFIKTNQNDCAWGDERPSTSKPSTSSTSEAPVVEEATVPEVKERDTKVRSAIAPGQGDSVDDLETKAQSAKPIPVADEPIEKTSLSSTVPEVIYKAADRARDIVKKTMDQVAKLDPIEAIKETFEKPGNQLQEALAKPIETIQGAFEKPIEHIKETLDKPLGNVKQAAAEPRPEKASDSEKTR